MRATWRFLLAVVATLALLQCCVVSAEDGDPDDDPDIPEEMESAEEDLEGGEDEALDESPEAIIAEYDKDGDGKLSLEEILIDENAEEEEIHMLKQEFDKADLNKDNNIDIDELPKMLESMNNLDEEAAKYSDGEDL
mmetsp:Transcript_63600/g.110840  ORF Transcript_63600/g.110840 Transcript_63600/m.110840 type:complete len:137 (+) Transcript_63600:74-484(+)